MLRAKQGLVALDVDIDICSDGLGDGLDAIRPACAVFGSEYRRKAVFLGEGEDFIRVCGDQHLIEKRARSRSSVNPGDHGFSGDFAEHFAGQSRRAEACGDNGENTLLLEFLLSGAGFNQVENPREWFAKASVIQRIDGIWHKGLYV